MSSSSFCSDDVTLPLSIISASLLVLSELIGSQGNKGEKCTSIVQFICAACIWCYRKCYNAYLQCCCVHDKTTLAPDDTSSIAAEVSKNVVVPQLPDLDIFPTWRKKAKSRPALPLHSDQVGSSSSGLVLP